MRTPPDFASTQRGLALVAVLWTIAILALVVSGLSLVVRGEIRQVAAVHEHVRVEALARAAMQSVALQLSVTPIRAARPVVLELEVLGQRARVTARPLNGLIDLNGASPALLAEAFQVGLSMDADSAQAMARDAVAFRDRRDRTGQALRFAAVEELQQVLRGDHDRYARVVGLFTADGTGWSGVNALAAPPDVLLVLAGGNVAAAQRYGQQRDSADPAMDATQLTQRFLDNSVGNRYRLEVELPLADGRTAARHGLLLLQVDPDSGAPWMLPRTWRPARASG